MSYRAYLNTFLDRASLKEKNHEAPEGQKYCNALCQEYVPRENFSGVHVICNACRNRINMAMKQIDIKRITLEQFKENPRVVYPCDLATGVIAKRICQECREERSVDLFEAHRRECKVCVIAQASDRVHHRLTRYLSDMEVIKHNLQQLEAYLQNIPKDALLLILDHHHIGRRPQTTKSTLILSILQHFQRLLPTHICQGGCGSLVEPFSTCDRCSLKVTVSKDTFLDNLDDLVQNLEPMRNRMTDMDRFNKDHLRLIAKKLGVKCDQVMRKATLFDRVNEALEMRSQASQPQQKKVHTRESDGFVDATSLCQDHNKPFMDWFVRDETQDLVDALHSSGHDVVALDTDGKQQHWVHPDLSLSLMQYVSPAFGLEISRWARSQGLL